MKELLTRQNYNKVFAKNLRRILKENDMTQLQLSQTTGITKAGVNQYAQGVKLPSLINLISMSKALNCTVNELTLTEVRGYWTTVLRPETGDVTGYRCSVCGKNNFYDFMTNFCPECGADMRGDK